MMKQLKGVFLITSILFIISALSPILVPFSTGEDGMMNMIGYIAGAMFWMGLIPGIVGCVLLNRQWKKMGKRIGEKGQKKLPTALHFFSNPPAKIFDVVMFIGIAGVIYGMVDITASTFIVVLSLTMMLAGVYGHFLLNGDIFNYIFAREKMLKNRKEEKNEEN